MKKGIITVSIAFVFCLSFFYSSSQNPFTLMVSPLDGADVFKRTLDKGYVALGGYGPGSSIIKFDSLGNYQWRRDFTDAYFYKSSSKGALLCKRTGGYYYVDVYVGSTNGYPAFDVILLNDSGNVVNGYNVFNRWPSGSFEIYSFEDNDRTGDYLITGEFYDENQTTGTIYLNKSYVMRFNSMHNGVSALNSDLLLGIGPKYTYAKDLNFPNNNYETLIVGNQFAMKLDSSNNVIWQKSYTDGCNGFIVQEDSNSFIFERTLVSVQISSRVRKIDYSGNVLLCKQFNGLKILQGAKLDSNHLLISGLFNNHHRIILKTDMQMNIIQSFAIDSVPIGVGSECSFIDTTDTSFLSTFRFVNVSNVAYFKKNYLDTICNATPFTLTTTTIASQSSISNNTFSFFQPTPNVSPFGANGQPPQVVNIGCVPLVGIDNFSNIAPTLSIFPNPASTYFKINHPFKKDDKIILSDVLGKTILSRIIKDAIEEEKFNVTDIPNGVYFLRLQNNENSISKKVIIQH